MPILHAQLQISSRYLPFLDKPTRCFTVSSSVFVHVKLEPLHIASTRVLVFEIKKRSHYLPALRSLLSLHCWPCCHDMVVK